MEFRRVLFRSLLRDDAGRGVEFNPSFLDPQLAVHTFAEPALEGLRHKLGALVFQLSPVPDALLRDLPALLRRLGAMLQALPSLRPLAPDAAIAVEVRDPERSEENTSELQSLMR